MWLKKLVSESPRRERGSRVRVEGLETRSLLSAVAAHAGSPHLPHGVTVAPIVLTPSESAWMPDQPGSTLSVTPRGMLIWRGWTDKGKPITVRDWHGVVLGVHASTPSETSRVLKYGWNTIVQGYRGVTSKQTKTVALNYLDLAFSPKTWDVGLSFLRDALSGDSAKIARYSKSASVAQVGHAFNSLSQSRSVQSYGQGFVNYGQAVVRAFNKV